MTVMYNNRQHFVEYSDWEDFIKSDSELMKSHYSVDSTGKGDWRKKKSKLNIKEIMEISYWSKYGKTEKGSFVSFDLHSLH